MEVFDLGFELRADLGFCMTPSLGEMRSYIVEGVGDFLHNAVPNSLCP